MPDILNEDNKYQLIALDYEPINTQGWRWLGEKCPGCEERGVYMRIAMTPDHGVRHIRYCPCCYLTYYYNYIGKEVNHG